MTSRAANDDAHLRSMATGVRRVFDEAIDRIIENDHEIAALMAQRVVLLGR